MTQFIAGFIIVAVLLTGCGASGQTAIPATATSAPSQPAAASPSAPAGTPQAGGPAGYLDDRSSATSVMQSYANALNRKEYLRAYSYWEPEAAASQLPLFATFEQGYANTRQVDLSTGQVNGDAGAGQLYYTVPVTLVSHQADGSIQTFVGCYTLHLSQPAIQATPPFRPIGITAAKVDQVANNADTAGLMGRACQGR